MHFCCTFLLVQESSEDKPPAGKLYAAVEKGDLEAVKQILLHATADDVNYQATNEVFLN